MAEDRELPGWPKKQLVKRVRSHLWHYGIRPKGEAWRATWSWASAIAHSYVYISWPLPSEIATQYVLLLLNEMRQNHGLKLPYRADKVIPEHVQRLLPASSEEALKLDDRKKSPDTANPPDNQQTSDGEPT